jgi:hypothetical protein
LIPPPHRLAKGRRRWQFCSGRDHTALPGTDARWPKREAAAPEVAKTPLQSYAARWTNPDQKPVLAIVILDRGVAAGGLDPSALAALPFAVTIAVDPLGRMRRRRRPPIVRQGMRWRS